MPTDTSGTKSVLGPRNRFWFLQALLECGTVAEACRLSKVDRANVYRTMQEDVDFKASVAEARDIGIEALKDIAFARAAEKSDVLLMFLIKQADPSYRDNYHTPEDDTDKVSLRDVMNAIRPEVAD